MNGKHRYIDITVGFFMIIGFLSLFLLITKVSSFTALTSGKGYHIMADFTDIGSLKIRAPVTIAGVKIGEVTQIELQPGDLNAKVTMVLRKDKKIPYAEDTSARILTEGLIGSSYISIVPGFDSDEDGKTEHLYLREGDVIAKTQGAIILENLIGQLLFNIKK